MNKQAGLLLCHLYKGFLKAKEGELDLILHQPCVEPNQQLYSFLKIFNEFFNISYWLRKQLGLLYGDLPVPGCPLAKTQ